MAEKKVPGRYRSFGQSGGSSAEPEPAEQITVGPFNPNLREMTSNLLRPTPQRPSPAYTLTNDFTYPPDPGAPDAMTAPPPPAIDRPGRLHPPGLVGPSMEEAGRGAQLESLRQGAFDMPDWTGSTDASGVRTVNLDNLSQAQMGADANARAMFAARDAIERASIQQMYGADPQDEALRAKVRNTAYESLMPRKPQPLYGEGGVFQQGAEGNAFATTGATPRPRSIEDALEQYGEQKAIDRAGTQEEMQQRLQIVAMKNAAIAKARLDPRFGNKSAEEQQAILARAQAPFVDILDQLDRVDAKLTVASSGMAQP